jgi:hypothetical protein
LSWTFGLSGAVVAGRPVPSKSKTPDIQARQQDGKGNVDPASSGAVAASQQMPSPKRKPPDIEVKKQDGKGKADSANSGEDEKRRQGRAGKPPPREKATGYGLIVAANQPRR